MVKYIGYKFWVNNLIFIVVQWIESNMAIIQYYCTKWCIKDDEYIVVELVALRIEIINLYSLVLHLDSLAARTH